VSAYGCAACQLRVEGIHRDAGVVTVWVDSLPAPVVRWVVRAFILATVFMLVAGIAVATLGQAGRTVYLPIVSATKAGNDQGRCADLAAGTGITMSLVLTAAVLDPGLGGWFDDVWRTTPLLSLVPTPTPGYDFLLPSAAEGILRPAFMGYLPIVHVGLALPITAAGVLSLFVRATWANEYGSRIWQPILFAVGAAIAIALVVIALILLAKAQDPG
jgi:hypothetical protein